MHRIQAKMDMRFFLESTVHAAYSLANTDTDIYLDHENKRVRNPQDANPVVYSWINDAFPESSKAIKGMKDGINAQTAHANVTTSAHNFALVAGERPEIHTTYFDFEEDRLVKSDLWQIGQAGLIAIDLLIGTQRIAGGFLPSTFKRGRRTTTAADCDQRRTAGGTAGGYHRAKRIGSGDRLRSDRRDPSQQSFTGRVAKGDGFRWYDALADRAPSGLPQVRLRVEAV
jgi:hypothetical protein